MVQSTRAWGLLRRFGELALDLLFPIECVGCGIEQFHYCGSCQQRLRALVQGARCFYCKKSWYSGRACPSCSHQQYLPHELQWIGSYASPMLGHAIRELKFGLRKPIAVTLGDALALRCQTINDCVVVPIPLSRRRMLERGFNQAAMIGERICQSRGWMMNESLLRRTRNTKAQAQLENEKRADNIRGAFEWVGGSVIPERVLLVDDVWTTGSTMMEAIRVLEEAGVQEVYGAVVALG